MNGSQFHPSRSTKAMTRSTLSILALLIALTITTTASAQSAGGPTPVASGTLREGTQNAALGRWEAFTTESNTFGFWLRFHAHNRVYTVVPFELQADGKIAFWYIEYSITGATDPNRAEGWQWQEVAGGRVLLDPATATESTIGGAMARTYQMVGYTRVPETNARFHSIVLSIP